jgi:hypothetical protein
MTSPLRLTLRELTIAGENQPPASVSFGPGLNLVVGASETGKSFIFEAIDFMLGSGGKLRRIPNAIPYDRVFLAIDPTNQPPFTLRRAFAGGPFEAAVYGNGRDHSPTDTLTLNARHSDETSLSGYLLKAIGLENRQVRKNDRGEKTALSFRDVVHLTLIDETSIIQQTSPVISKNYSDNTREKNIFAFFPHGAR